MDIPRFTDTPFSLGAFHRAARAISPIAKGARSITIPHPSYVLHSAAALENEFPAGAQHVGWQSLLLEENEPHALVEAAPNAMGRLAVISTTRGRIPAAIVQALATAERENIIGEGDAFAVVSVPQVGVTAVWLPAAHVVISVGPDVFVQMPVGHPTDAVALTQIVSDVFRGRRP